MYCVREDIEAVVENKHEKEYDKREDAELDRSADLSKC